MSNKMKRQFTAVLTVLLLGIFSNISYASSDTSSTEEFNAAETIMHHIKDAHEFHIGGDLAFYLPVILWSDNGLDVFSSSHLYHNPIHIEGLENEHAYQYESLKGNYILFHEKIYLANSANTLEIVDGHPTNLKPLDFSITKNVFSMFLSVLILLLIFLPTASKYKKSSVPRGIASFMEPLILFVRDEIARPNIGEKKYMKFMPYLLTVFFFIWVNNLIGLIPFFPFSANLSGNIGFTVTLALCTFVLTTINGNKHYWKHIFATPGVPIPLLLIMIPVEFLGMFTKPFALMVRLFANITAGHIVVLSLVSLIFIFKNVGMAGVSIPFVLFISVLELLVAALQAFIFTMLSALFIGQAVEDHH